MRRQIALFLIATLVPQLVSAQALTPGSRVRISHPFAGRNTGTLVALTPDTVELRLTDRAEPLHLPLAEVTRLEVSRGKERHMGNAVVGLAVGATVGAIAGYASGEDDCNHALVCFDRRGSAALGAIALGSLGGVIGLIKGVIPTETWERVPTEARRVSLVAPLTGRGVGLRVAF